MPPFTRPPRLLVPIPYAFTESTRFLCLVLVSYRSLPRLHSPRTLHDDDIVIDSLQILPNI